MSQFYLFPSNNTALLPLGHISFGLMATNKPCVEGMHISTSMSRLQPACDSSTVPPPLTDLLEVTMYIKTFPPPWLVKCWVPDEDTGCFISLFVVYSTMLSISMIIQHWQIGLINYELEKMWKSKWFILGYYPSTCLEGLRTTMKNSQDNQSPGCLKHHPP